MQNPDPENLLEAFAASRKLDWNPSQGFARRVMSGLAPAAEAETAPTAARGSRPLPGSFGVTVPGPLAAGWERLCRLLSPPIGLRNLGVSLACLALAAGILVWRAERIDPGQRSDSGPTRIKGEEFRIAFLAGNGVALREVGEGEAFQAGDKLQPLYSSARAGYISLFSIDNAGTVSSYSGEGPGAASPPGQGRSLPFAVELDDSRGAELFIAVRTSTPADHRVLEGELRRAWEENGRRVSGLSPRPARIGLPEARIATFRIAKGGGTL